MPACCGFLIAFLFIILMSLSVVHVGVDQFALPKKRSSAVVLTGPDDLLANGPYWLGPDWTLQTVPSRVEQTIVKIAPFVKNSGNELPIVMEIFWRQNPKDIAKNFKTFGDHTAVAGRLLTQMEVAMKGKSSSAFALNDYISNIEGVQAGFLDAVKKALTKTGLGIEIHALYMRSVQLPSQVIESSLQGMILSESEVIKKIQRNATLIRAETDTKKRKINAQTQLVKLQGKAKSEAIIKTAMAEAAAIAQGAEGRGLALFFDALNVTDLETKAAYQKYLAISRKQLDSIP